MNIEKHFSRENCIRNLAMYEMYYQISIGNLVGITESKEINSDIELQYALGSIYELLKDLEQYKEEEVNFFDELKKQSAMDALQNFVNENLELVKNSTIEVESIVNAINDDMFFNETMEEICEENKEIQIAKWSEIITDELASAIMQSLKDLEANSN